MSDKKPGWFSRLRSKDGPSVADLEEHLAQAQAQVAELTQALEVERQHAAGRDERIAGLEAQVAAAALELETQLENANQQHASVREAIEAEHKQQSALFKSVATRQYNQAKQETERLTQTIDSLEAELARARGELQAATDRAAELERVAASDARDTQLQEQEQSLRQAQQALLRERQEHEVALRDRDRESGRLKQTLEQTVQRAESRAQEAVARSAHLEHELETARNALQEAQQSGANEELLHTLEQEIEQLRQYAEQAEENVEQVNAQANLLHAERVALASVARDLWIALGHSVGDAATLALTLGLDPGEVEACHDVASAGAALSRALVDRALCSHARAVESADGVFVELHPIKGFDDEAITPWLVAFSTQYLQGALHRSFVPEAMRTDDDSVTIQLVGSAAPPSVALVPPPQAN